MSYKIYVQSKLSLWGNLPPCTLNMNDDKYELGRTKTYYKYNSEKIRYTATDIFRHTKVEFEKH